MGSTVEQRLAALETSQSQLREQLGNVTAAQEETIVAMNVTWMLLSGMIIFLMQFGFCMLETGSVTSKSTESIMIKNLGDLALSSLAWWAVGYAFAFGGGGEFIGFSSADRDGTHTSAWFATNGVQASEDWAKFFFHLNFVATASTIVSGAIAERAHILSYFFYSTLCACIIYPPVAHWEWSSTGWASPYRADHGAWQGGVIDFAGCGAVHLVGGVGAVIGAAIIGPRKGRYDPSSMKPIPMPGHSSVLQVMGTFILWVGWYGFNAGSTMRMDGVNSRTAARVAVTTTLAASMGGVTGMLVPRCLGTTKTYDVPSVCNGVLAGLVSITGGCATVTAWASLLIGVIGGVAFLVTSRLLLERGGIDDPLDAGAVHGSCGVWGLLAASLFSTAEYTADVYGPMLTPGLFYSAGGQRLTASVVFTLATVAWVGLTSSLIFYSLKNLGMLRGPDKLGEAEIDLDASIIPTHTSTNAAIAVDVHAHALSHAYANASARAVADGKAVSSGYPSTASILSNEFGLDPTLYGIDEPSSDEEDFEANGAGVHSEAERILQQTQRSMSPEKYRSPPPPEKISRTVDQIDQIHGASPAEPAAAEFASARAVQSELAEGELGVQGDVNHEESRL